MTTNSEPRKSKLALAIEGRERKLYPFDVQGFFGLGDKAINKIAIRVATKKEEDAAVAAAHAHAAKCSDLESARRDPDLLNDSKVCEILFAVCRDADDPKYPAFPWGAWMRENLTTDQLAALLNLYHEARKAQGPIQWDLSYETVEALADVCALTAESDVPESVLADRPREWLSQAFVMLAQRWRELKAPPEATTDVDSGDG